MFVNVSFCPNYTHIYTSRYRNIFIRVETHSLFFPVDMTGLNTVLSWPAWTLVELASLNAGWAGQLEPWLSWPAWTLVELQVELASLNTHSLHCRAVQQDCSCMLKQTVHGLMNEQTWILTLLEPSPILFYHVNSAVTGLLSQQPCSLSSCMFALPMHYQYTCTYGSSRTSTKQIYTAYFQQNSRKNILSILTHQ